MKKLRLLLLFIPVLISGLSANAQNADRFPRIRERIVQAKLHEIRLSLKLDDATFERFRPVYIKYEKEISSINFQDLARLLKVDAEKLSAEEADQLIVRQLEVAKSLIAIRERYYGEFKTVLSPQQIIKLYQTESELRKKVMQELNRRLMSR